MISDATRAAPEVVDEAPEPVREAEVEHRLALVPPRDEDPTAGAGQAAGIEQLGIEVTRLEEELYAARIETEDLRARIAELEARLAERESGLAVPDSEFAQLEQRLRDARLEADDRAAAESAARSSAVPDPVVAPAGRAGSSGRAWYANPLIWSLLVLILVVLGALLWWLNRNRDDDAPRRPVKASGRAAPQASPTKRAVPQGRSEEFELRARIRSEPEDLPSHLALLRVLAQGQDDSRLGAALDEMFGYVSEESDPSWKAALELVADRLPDHPLIVGSLDSVRGTRTKSGTTEAFEASEQSLEEQTRDILRILEQDEEGKFDEPDSEMGDWLAGDDAGPDQSGARPAPPRTGREEPLPDLDFDMSELPDPEIRPAEDSPSVDFEKFLREPGREDGDMVGSAGGEGVEGRLETASPDEFEDASPSLNWKEEAGWEADAESAAAPADGADDIFSLGEDDVEVKLDLAQAYLSMDDPDAARTVLEEVLNEGSPQQQEQARKLLDGI